MAKKKKSAVKLVLKGKLGMDHLVDVMSEATGCPPTKAHAGIKALVAAVTEGVKSGYAVNIAGLGIFRPVNRAGRTVTLPNGGKQVKVAARTSVACKVSSKLKKSL